MTGAVKTICILGAESTGKSTLAQALAAQLNTHWVPEFARDYWARQQGRLVYDDYLLIAHNQVQQEEQLLLACSQAHTPWLVCDTSPLTTLLYALYDCGKADLALWSLSCRSYDYTFLCAPDIPFVQDGTRSNDSFRQWQHQRYQHLLQERAITYHLLTGNLEQRLNQVTQVLS